MLAGILSETQSWSDVTARIHAALPGSFASFNGQDFTDKSRSFGNVAGADDSDLRNFLENYSWRNPWARLWVSARTGAVVSTETHLPAHTLKGHPFIEEFLKSMGDFEAGTGIKLESDASNFTQIAVHYDHAHAARYQPFIEDVLRRISAPLTQTLALSRMIDAHRLAGAAKGAIVDRMPDAAFALKKDGTLLAANPAAEAMISDGTQVRLVSGKIAFTKPAAQRWIEASRMVLTSGLSQTPVPAVLHDGEQWMRLSLNAVPFWTTTPGFSSGPFHLLVIRLTTPEPDLSGRLDAVQILFRLTAAELRFCVLLGAGLTLERIARRENVSLETIRERAKIVFAKTRTKRQAELVALLHALKD